jgi:hypothetical protein
VKSREARQRQTYRLIATIGGGLGVFVLLGLGLEVLPWGPAVAKGLAFIGSGYLSFQEAQPQFTYWRWRFAHPDETWEEQLAKHSWPTPTLMRVLSCLGASDPTPDAHASFLNTLSACRLGR